MMFHLYATVDCLYEGTALTHNGRDLCFEVNMQEPNDNKDKFKVLVGDALSRVSVSVSEKISGPSYSSMSISVTVTLTCDQSEKILAESRELALGECLGFIDTQLADLQGCFLEAVHEAARREQEDREGRER